jgi:hypothetical protein
MGRYERLVASWPNLAATSAVTTLRSTEVKNDDRRPNARCTIQSKAPVRAAPEASVLALVDAGRRECAMLLRGRILARMFFLDATTLSSRNTIFETRPITQLFRRRDIDQALVFVLFLFYSN